MDEKVVPINNAPVALTPLTPQAPVKAKTMTFPEAVQEIILGKKVARLSWSPAKDYGFLSDDYLTIFTRNNFHTWKVNESDMRGDDWVVVIG